MKSQAGGNALSILSRRWVVTVWLLGLTVLTSCAPALRTETAPADAPFTAEDLARNFEEIVFRYEFRFDDQGRQIDEPLTKPLKRWEGTIRYRLTGDGVVPEDHRTVADLTARIEPLTGLAFQEADSGEDMLISIASSSGAERIVADLEARDWTAHRERYEQWRENSHWICGATLSASRDEPNRLVDAHIFLRAETTGLRRRACLHEEITQALGLTNDSATARPSIFNDDQEFALLTRHDEILLRALYHPSLRPGMAAEEAMPTARAVLEMLLAKHHGTGGNP